MNAAVGINSYGPIPPASPPQWGPLDDGSWRYARRPHSVGLLQRERHVNADGTAADGTHHDSMPYLGLSTYYYFECYFWDDVNLNDYLHPDDQGRQVLYARIGVRLLLTVPTSGEQAAICVKLAPPDQRGEPYVTDQQQAEISGWMPSSAQMATHGIDTPRSWTECTVAAVDNRISWAAMYRPAYPLANVGMGFVLYLEGYALAPLEARP